MKACNNILRNYYFCVNLSKHQWKTFLIDLTGDENLRKRQILCQHPKWRSVNFPSQLIKSKYYE